MSDVQIRRTEDFGRNFIAREFLPAGEDEYYLRNAQQAGPPKQYRRLRSDEIETLVKNANTCGNWDEILVADPFQPMLIKNSEFSGLVRIGKLENVVLEHHDLQVPAGITNSRVIACDIGDNSAVHDVRYVAHYIIGDNCILLNVDELHCTSHAKFGNGTVKQGEPESVRVWLDLANETGGRAVMPFDGMIAADAYLWAKYRDDAELQQKLGDMTQNHIDPRRGYYGTVGNGCVIKSCRIIKDAKIGPSCYVKGANKLKNVTLNSSEAEPTQIGEGVELVNGIVGYGCHIFYGCKAVRFVMGNNAALKYGARLIHSLLGDNSTVSCCEMLNNLIFPAHEQHHNNSFLTATIVLGQSNLPAGATVGSNHNSRANDGEIRAGRGFWPGLCTTLKHSCTFASFVLLAKGDYPAEMNIPLPFSLLSNDTSRDRLVIMPAYWWLYNMYALARNTWKFLTRDKRKTKVQHVEFDSLAPDTAEEMFTAMRLLEIWTAKAWLRAAVGERQQKSDEELAALGRELLNGPAGTVAGLEVLGENMEASKRPVVVNKAREGYLAYKDMLLYYAAKNLIAYLQANPSANVATMSAALSGARERVWANLGGQLVAEPDRQSLVARIKSGGLASWDAVHGAYNDLWSSYPLAKQRHAWATLLELLQVQSLTAAQWPQSLDKAVAIQEFIRDQVYLSRKKDFDNPIRQGTFQSRQEMEAVVGTADGNSFVKQVRQETEAFRATVEQIKRRG